MQLRPIFKQGPSNTDCNLVNTQNASIFNFCPKWEIHYPIWIMKQPNGKMFFIQWLSRFLRFSNFWGFSIHLGNIKLEKAVSAFCFCNVNTVWRLQILRGTLLIGYLSHFVLAFLASTRGWLDCGTLIAISRRPCLPILRAGSSSNQQQQQLKSSWKQFSGFREGSSNHSHTVASNTRIQPKVIPQRNRKNCL